MKSIDDNKVLKFDDMTPEQQKLAKELVIARLQILPDSWRICIG